MKYNAKIRPASAPDRLDTVSGADGVYLVNQETHGDPYVLYEKAIHQDPESFDGELLLINPAAILSVELETTDQE